MSPTFHSRKEQMEINGENATRKESLIQYHTFYSLSQSILTRALDFEVISTDTVLYVYRITSRGGHSDYSCLPNIFTFLHKLLLNLLLKTFEVLGKE